MTTKTRRSPRWSHLLVALIVSLATSVTLLDLTAGATGVANTTITLSSQSSWVLPGQQFDLGFTVRSDLGESALALKVAVYPQLSSVFAFDKSLSGSTPSGQLPLSTTPAVAMSSVATTTSGSLDVALRLNVATSPSATNNLQRNVFGLALDCSPGTCAGVYPVVIAVTNNTTHKTVATLMTQLCYIVNQQGLFPLDVAIVLPLGSNVALSPIGLPKLSPSEVATIASIVKTIRRAPSAHVSLEIYPQLLQALARTHDAGSVVTMLRRLLRRSSGEATELLRATFAPTSLSSLAKSGLSSSFRAELTRASSVDSSILGMIPAANPYVSYEPLGSNSLALLRQNDINDVVLPGSSASVREQTTPTEPLYVVANGASIENGLSGTPRPVKSPEGLIADSDLASRFSVTANDPVLSAHRLLAELAQIYFDLPGSAAPRGVVVAPATFSPNAKFLATVLGGIVAPGSVLSSTTVASTFGALQVGANNEPTNLSTTATSSVAGQISSGAVTAAQRALDALSTVTNHAPSLVTPLSDSILIGESTALSSRSRSEYLDAAQNELRLIGASLTVPGSRTVTLTTRSGNIPIAISSSFPYPLRLFLRLRSEDLTLPGGDSVTVVVNHSETLERIRVETKTSGVLALDVQVLTRSGGTVLQTFVLNVRSTAVSWVAIALSLAALLVLAVWWFRSYARHRRRLARERALAHLEGAEAPTA